MQVHLKKIIIGSLIVGIFVFSIGLLKADTFTSIFSKSPNSPGSLRNKTEAKSTQKSENTKTNQVTGKEGQPQNSAIDARQVAATARIEATWNTISLTFCRPVKVCLYEFVDPNAPKNEVPGYTFSPNETEGMQYINPNRTKWSRKASLTPGGTYRLHYSVLLYDGDYAEYEKSVTVPLNGTGVSSVNAINANQIRIKFKGSIDPGSLSKYEHYRVSDASGQFNIIHLYTESDAYANMSVVLTLGRMMKAGSVVDVSVSGVCRAQNETGNTSVPNNIPQFECGPNLSNVLQPYRTTITINGLDLVPPQVTNISFTKDASGRVISLCVVFSEGLKGDAGIPGGSVTITNPTGQVLTGALYTSQAFGNGAFKVVFPVAPSVNIYSGQYTVSISAFTQDPQGNSNIPCTRTVNF